MEICQNLIVGGGMSGLRLAKYFSDSKDPGDTILCESRDKLGGRVHTVKKKISGKTYSLEAGAGRFCMQHKNLVKLLREYGYGNKNYAKNNNKVTYIYSGKQIDVSKFTKKQLKLYPIIEKALDKVSGKVNTDDYSLSELLTELTKMGAITSVEANLFTLFYPYPTSFHNRISTDIIKLLRQQYSQTFYSLKGGLTKLVNSISHSIKGVDIRTNKELVQLDYIEGYDKYICTFNNNNVKHVIIADNIFLCIPPSSIQKIYQPVKIIRDGLFSHISSFPLYRIYAVYPKNSDGSVWFRGLNRIITDNRLKYIIPINPDTGLIMISYTDGPDADFIHDQVEGGTPLKTVIAKYVSKLFPTLKIPAPKWIDGYYWNVGCHYFTPGISSDLLQRVLVKPTPHNIWLGGESYSSHSEWIEGSLQSANSVYNSYLANQD